MVKVMAWEASLISVKGDKEISGQAVVTYLVVVKIEDELE